VYVAIDFVHILLMEMSAFGVIASISNDPPITQPLKARVCTIYVPMTGAYV
jgi:hypothetical protein